MVRRVIYATGKIPQLVIKGESSLQNIYEISSTLADLAVASLIEEVSLTPKPGLVDLMDNGSHNDLTYTMMVDSANSLKETFYNMALVAFNERPSQNLREQIGEIGREGEKIMFQVTNGVNTHKGAIWSLGLLTAAAAIHYGQWDEETLCFTAGEIAKYEDRFIPLQLTNGIKAIQKYGVHGAKAEAQFAFPHIRKYSLPEFKKSLKQYNYGTAKLRALLSLIAHLDDTCILHRGGMEGLHFAKQYAKQVLIHGDLEELQTMNEQFKQRNLSPGGSADLLAATIYLYKICQLQQSKKAEVVTVN